MSAEVARVLAIMVAILTVAPAGIVIGMATSNACKATAQQPEAAGAIRTTMLLGSALSEATAIYGFVTALLLLFVK